MKLNTHPHVKLRKREKLHTGKSNLVQQHFRDECDINQIVRKANINGKLPDLIEKNPMYGDFSDAPTFQEALDIVHVAQTQFDALNSATRDKFQNDPAKFLEFMADPKTDPKELVKLGLAKVRPIPDISNTDVLNAINGLKNDDQTKKTTKKADNS